MENDPGGLFPITASFCGPTLGRQLKFSCSLITRNKGMTASSTAPTIPFLTCYFKGMRDVLWSSVILRISACSYIVLAEHIYQGDVPFWATQKKMAPMGFPLGTLQCHTQQPQVRVFSLGAKAMQHGSWPIPPREGLLLHWDCTMATLPSITCLTTHSRAVCLLFQNASFILLYPCLGIKCYVLFRGRHK